MLCLSYTFEAFRLNKGLKCIGYGRVVGRTPTPESGVHDALSSLFTYWSPVTSSDSGTEFVSTLVKTTSSCVGGCIQGNETVDATGETVSSVQKRITSVPHTGSPSQRQTAWKEAAPPGCNESPAPSGCWTIHMAKRAGA